MDNLIRCTICGNEYPATAEYFNRNSASKIGLRRQCKVCARQKQKDWRHADPQRYVEYARQTYLRNTDTIKGRVKRWQQTDKAKQARHAYRLRHVAEHKSYTRVYYQQRRDETLERALRWQRENPQRRLAIRQRREARKLSRPVNFTQSDWQFALDYFKGCCAACGRPAGLWHTLAADHWIALADDTCPGTIPSNIVPLCHGDGGCNNAKQDRKPLEWLESKFGIKQAQAVNKRIQEFFSSIRVT